MLSTDSRNHPYQDSTAYGSLFNSWIRPLYPVVNMARRYLNSTASPKPQAYQSRYSDQIASLYEQIMNRPAFSYNANRDPLFQQYRNQYIRDGQRAMQDSVGASAALTGGYGNSWATTAGYQAYGEYLKALNDKLPELEKQAREKYDAEGKTLRDDANLALSLDNREYGWYRDAMNDWQFDAKLALEQNKFNLQVQKYQDALLSSLSALSPNATKMVPYVVVQQIPSSSAVAAASMKKKQTGR